MSVELTEFVCIFSAICQVEFTAFVCIFSAICQVELTAYLCILSAMCQVQETTKSFGGQLSALLWKLRVCVRARACVCVGVCEREREQDLRGFPQSLLARTDRDTAPSYSESSVAIITA
jgi:hypothetical protein